MFEFVSLLDALNESIEGSTVLVPVDAALVQAARILAKRIDDVMLSEDSAGMTKALYLIPHMTSLLREMLATPLSRGDKKIETAADAKVTQLTKLRALR